MLKINPLGENIINQNNLSGSNENADLWLFGDSRISRWNENDFSSIAGTTINFGIEGQTTSQVLFRFKNQLTKDTSRWVLLEVGINDLKLIGLDRAQAGMIKETCYSNILSIVKLCKEHNVNIIVINIFPTGDIEFLRRFVWNDSVDLAIAEINDRLKSYCIDNDIFYFDAYSLLTGIGSDNNVKKMYQEDFLHINSDGYKLLTQNLINQYGDLIASKNNNAIQRVK